MACPAERREAEGREVVLGSIELVVDKYFMGRSRRCRLILVGDGIGHAVNRLDIVGVVVIAGRTDHLVGIIAAHAFVGNIIRITMQTAVHAFQLIVFTI